MSNNDKGNPMKNETMSLQQLCDEAFARNPHARMRLVGTGLGRVRDSLTCRIAFGRGSTGYPKKTLQGVWDRSDARRAVLAHNANVDLRARLDAERSRERLLAAQVENARLAAKRGGAS